MSCSDVCLPGPSASSGPGCAPGPREEDGSIAIVTQAVALTDGFVLSGSLDTKGA